MIIVQLNNNVGGLRCLSSIYFLEVETLLSVCSQNAIFEIRLYGTRN
jgi:hypothetical protein